MSNLYKMCYGKVSFPSKASAEKTALKFQQNVYRCPICFCFHCTKYSDWRKDYVHVTEFQKLQEEYNDSQKKNSNPTNKDLVLENLKTQVKSLEAKILDLKKENSIEEIRNGYRQRIWQLQMRIMDLQEYKEELFEKQFPMIF